MQTETLSTPPVKYFFDDDEPTKYEFQAIDQKHQKDMQQPPILKERFMFKATSNDAARTSYYTLQNKLLVQNKGESELTPELVLDLSQSRVLCVKPDDENPNFGFSITKNATTFTFYHSDKQVIDTWYEALKKICVLTTFHDDYKAIKMIGRGSFAKVYLVESKTTGKSFAVKAFTKETMAVSNKNNAKPSMLNEIDIMRSLDHENIIKLYEVYETEKSIYLVLELIQGKSLYEFLKRTNFREEVSHTKTINMVRSLLDALAYLASKGIMHRDLKPDNILLDKGEKVKIVDFGLATYIDVPNYIFKKCGTPGYIAPEVFRYDDKIPDSSYDDRCDVFSVGALLYYMLFNNPMFEGTTAADILKLNRKYCQDYPLLNTIKNEFKDPVSKISKDGINLLLDLVEFNAKKRITASQALAHSYFIPAPTGMQKIVGSNEFVVDALTNFDQGEIYSPCSPLKLNPLAQDYSPLTPLTPLTPLRLDTFEQASPLLPSKRDRFVKEDSLYLDLGRPELNGRVDTITSGSTNNSLLLANRVDSSSNIGTTTTPSAFAKKNATRTNTKGYKSHGQGASNQSFLKAAIFRTMQKNNSENLKEEDSFRNRLQKLQIDKKNSDDSPTDNFDQEDQARGNYTQSPEKEFQPPEEPVEAIGDENVEIPPQSNMERISLDVNNKYPTAKTGTSRMKRFHPFAPGNLIIPKNEVSNNF